MQGFTPKKYLIFMYCTITDLFSFMPEKHIIELSNDVSPYSTVNDPIVEDVTTQADSLIDSYLIQKMTVPLTVVPDLIRTISCKISIHYLHTRKSIMSEIWQKEFDRCMKTLDLIASGKLSLTTATAASNSYIASSSAVGELTDSILAGFY